MTTERSLLTGMKRGIVRRCPNCGDGKLFLGYLKIRSQCDACGHDNGQYPSDDAPPYFTILLVGHLIIGPLLFMPFIWTWPVATVLALTMPSVILLTLGLLPMVKGAVVGAQWAIAKAH